MARHASRLRAVTTAARLIAPLLALAVAPSVARAGGPRVPTFTDTTAARLSAPVIGSTDPSEKDYALADLDLDGDLDVIVARRQGLSGANNDSALPNALLMNEGGVLIERTAALAPDLLRSQRSRDVLAMDLNGDGWPDVLVADGTSAAPLLLVNLGEASGTWLGLAAAPAMLPKGLLLDAWTVSAGDLLGDGDACPDLFIGVRSGNDRLLANLGPGAAAGTWLGFADASVRLGANATTSAVRSSAVVDLNGDGDLDIVEGVTASAGQVRMLANDGSGFFTALPQTLVSGAAYNFGLGELNGDGYLDVFGVRNGSDQYVENLGAGPGDTISLGTAYTAPNSLGFGSICRSADLNGDGNDDFLVADLDQEFPTDCSRRLKIFLNSGAPPYLVDGYPTVQPWTPAGTSDVAILDLDGDSDLDMLVGHCAGHSVFVQDGPSQARGDANGDGVVDVRDLVEVITSWGPCGPALTPCPADLNHDGTIDVQDLVEVIVNFG